MENVANVSILVLVDFVRNGSISGAGRKRYNSFNPCFSGFCSECGRLSRSIAYEVSVSILVLVDFVRNAVADVPVIGSAIEFQSLF